MSDPVSQPELLRPRFHFTARRNWLNDPNGLVFADGEWHLFYQYNAKGINWGPNSWGHAVSADLLHWRQLDDALDPDDDFGWIWSGSAVIDHGNTSGLGEGGRPPLIAIYTAGAPPQRKPVVQCIASSADRGRTWRKFAGNPVMPNIEGENRDPKVVWHAPTKRWIMALYLARNDFALYASPDLKTWTHLQTLAIAGTSECPDFFELPIDGDPSRAAWVLWGGDGVYLLGSFDGRTFAPTTGPLLSERGPNGYAAQTWSDAPDGRRIQISWMRGGRYPYMPFNQQMSLPVELTLRTLPEGVRLCREPVAELGRLWERTQAWKDHALAAGAKLVPDPGEGLYDIDLVLEPVAGAVFRARIHGHELRWRSADGVLAFLGRDIAVPPDGGRLALRAIVDRTSVELFARGGSVSASFCHLPEPTDAPLEFAVDGAPCRLASLQVRHVRSALAAPGAARGRG